MLQVHPPTAVTQCAAAWLTRPPPAAQPGSSSTAGHAALASAACHPDLVVLRSNQLEVYAARAVGITAPDAAAPATPAAAAASGTGDGANSEAGVSLELLTSCQLFGVAESVAVLRGRAPGQRDALLLTFRQALTASVCDAQQWLASVAGSHCALQPAGGALTACRYVVHMQHRSWAGVEVPMHHRRTAQPPFSGIYAMQRCKAVGAALGRCPARAGTQQPALFRGRRKPQGRPHAVPLPAAGGDRWAGGTEGRCARCLR